MWSWNGRQSKHAISCKKINRVWNLEKLQVSVCKLQRPERNFETRESLSILNGQKTSYVSFPKLASNVLTNGFSVLLAVKPLFFPLHSPTNHYFFHAMTIQAFHASSFCYFHSHLQFSSIKRFHSRKILKLNCSTSNGDKVCVFVLMASFYQLYLLILCFQCCRMIIFWMLLFLLVMVSLSVEVAT